jgi:hypothetical protein
MRRKGKETKRERNAEGGSRPPRARSNDYDYIKDRRKIQGVGEPLGFLRGKKTGLRYGRGHHSFQLPGTRD